MENNKIKVTESGGFKKIHYISAENSTATTTIESSVMAMDALDLIRMRDMVNYPRLKSQACTTVRDGVLRQGTGIQLTQI